jgi:hypothetical protein
MVSVNDGENAARQRAGEQADKPLQPGDVPGRALPRKNPRSRDREERAVREVQHAHQAPDKRQPGCDEEVQRAEAEPRDQQQNDRAHAVNAPLAALSPR